MIDPAWTDQRQSLACPVAEGSDWESRKQSWQGKGPSQAIRRITSPVGRQLRTKREGTRLTNRRQPTTAKAQ
jgi:hypothetical protein